MEHGPGYKNPIKQCAQLYSMGVQIWPIKPTQKLIQITL